MILRSWICENRRCEHWFDAYEANPKCPDCGCVRVSWRPAGGHIGTKAKGADAELRALADIFKLPDLNSAERDRGAKKVNLPAAQAGGEMRKFGEFIAPVVPGAGAVCVPTSNKVDYKVKATPGSRLVPDSGFSQMSVAGNTVVEARHKS